MPKRKPLQSDQLLGIMMILASLCVRDIYGKFFVICAYVIFVVIVRPTTNGWNSRPACDFRTLANWVKRASRPQKSYQSCQERYNFGANGKLTTTSGKERTEGEYLFRYIEESSLPALAMTTTFDNNEPDCSGNIINQSNDSFAFFVKLDNRHNPTKMQWCQDKDGKDCHARFWRILP